MSVAPTFHWIYGKKAPVRKKLAELFYAQSKENSLKISESWPDQDSLPDGEKPDFWVVSDGGAPPLWVMDGNIPIIQFYWTNSPDPGLEKRSSALITPYIPKPMSFIGLLNLFRDSLNFWASPCLHAVQSPNRRHRLAIIEDEESQRFLMNEAIEEIGFRSKVIFFNNGSEALDGLRKMDKEGKAPILLLLDLLLPGMRGDDILRTIKSSESLRSIPVALLTCAQEPGDLSFLKKMPRHFCFRLPLLESDSIDLLNRCFNFFRHARPVP